MGFVSVAKSPIPQGGGSISAAAIISDHLPILCWLDLYLALITFLLFWWKCNMGWAKALFGRLTMWSSNKKSSSDSGSPSSYPPVFSVDRTEVAVAATATGVPELTLGELNKATRSFSASMVVSRGPKAMVYQAKLPIGNGRNAAAVAKMLGPPSPGASWSASEDELLRQLVLVLSRLKHDNLVRLLGYTIDPTAGVRALLFEFADMGTLHDVMLSRPAALSWAQRTGIALDVARALEYLHYAAALSHVGISSSKVLLFQASGAGGFRAKIDCNLFKQLELQLPPDENARAITEQGICYMAPEYITTGRGSSPKLDVYSYGVLLLELLTGRICWPARWWYLLEQADTILREGRVEQFMDPKLGMQYPPARALELARMALCCVQMNPQSRPSMGEVVAQIVDCHIASSSETNHGQVTQAGA